MYEIRKVTKFQSMSPNIKNDFEGLKFDIGT
jgi:hypothetical protein